MTDPNPEFGGRVILATMQTAAGEEFTSRVEGGDHLLIVADEVHQIGSPQNSRALQIDAGPRLGLSATPSRYGDPEGTARIFSYFGPCIPPAITLQDAITAGRLVHYEYYPHPVSLSAEEAQSWADLTRAIGLELRRSKSTDQGGRCSFRKSKDVAHSPLKDREKSGG
jgi:superfamily II DNA or RNA helicase